MTETNKQYADKATTKLCASLQELIDLGETMSSTSKKIAELKQQIDSQQCEWEDLDYSRDSSMYLKV